MGATMPALERALGGARPSRYNIADLYAANTFGALLGVLGSAFLLVPWLGLTRTAAVCASLNLLCAFVAFRILAPHVAPVAPGASMLPAPPQRPRLPLLL